MIGLEEKVQLRVVLKGALSVRVLIGINQEKKVYEKMKFKQLAEDEKLIIAGLILIIAVNFIAFIFNWTELFQYEFPFGFAQEVPPRGVLLRKSTFCSRSQGGRPE